MKEDMVVDGVSGSRSKKRVCLGLFPVSKFTHVKMGAGYPCRKAERWSNVHIKRATEYGEPADTQVRVPTVKKQQEVQVVVKEIIDEHTEIAVYKNGYVIYRVDKRATVFPLHSCNDYIYDSGVSDTHKLESDFFENENWYVRLILEGEDRLIHNQNARIEAKSISYSAVSEEWNVLAEDAGMLEKLIMKEQIKAILNEITVKQRYMIVRHYLDEVSQKEIATELGISSSAVSSMIRQAIQRVHRKMK